MNWGTHPRIKSGNSSTITNVSTDCNNSLTDGEKSNEKELRNDANLDLQSREETQNIYKKNM